uniref:Ubiquitin-like protease family profile domain-containing protein n=1 Tax=Fagus sylvatica TaxID=28930 RepID=A0A2N9IP95_FAGSY
MASIEVAPRIRHQCSVTKLMEVNKSLAEECKSQLQTTPFGWLLNLHCNIEASGRILEVMATRWNADARAFQVGDRLIPFTLYDIALILGLPVRGEPIDWNQSHSGGSVVEKLLDRHLKTTSPDRTKLVTLLTKTSIQVPNRVRLYIALVFSYFLFPTTSKKVNPSLLPLLDDRANLGTYAWGKAVYDFLVSGLSRAASSMQAKKGRGNLHIQDMGMRALGGWSHKNAEINQPFPRFLAWTHQRMYTKKASEAFSNSANVLSVLVAMPWEQDFNVVEEAMETLQETHGSSHPTISRDDGAGPSSIPQTPSNQLQLELQAERAEREALARQVRRLKDELDHVKAPTLTKPAPTLTLTKPAPTLTKPAPTLTLTKPAPTLTLTQPAPTLTLTKRAPTLTKPAAHSNPHCGLAKFTVQGCQERQSCQKEGQGGGGGLGKLTIKAGQCRGGSCSYGGFGPTRLIANEMAISTDTYELTGREVSSLLGDQAKDDGSRWISTAVVDAFKDVLMQKLTESGHPPPYINFIISVHGGTTILGMTPSTSTQRGKRTRKGKQPIQDDQPQPQSLFRPSWVRAMPKNCNRIFVPACHSGHFVMMVVDCLEKVFYFFYSLPSATHRALAPTLRKALEQICVENLDHKDVHTWLLKYKDDIPTQDKYASDCGIFMLTFMESLIFSNKIVQFEEADCPRIRQRILLEFYYNSLLPKAVQS